MCRMCISCFSKDTDPEWCESCVQEKAEVELDGTRIALQAVFMPVDQFFVLGE